MPLRNLLLAGTLLMWLAACAGNGAERKSGDGQRSLSSQGRNSLGLAQGHLDKGEIDQALARANAARTTDPDSAYVHATFAMIHARQGDTAKAGREFDRAVRAAPADGAILNAHASWLCEAGRREEADKQFVLALRDTRYATPFQALANAGKCALKAGNWSKAEVYLRKAVVLAPQDAQVLHGLALASLRLGKLMEARAFIERRDALGSDAQALELAARIEDAANDDHAEERYRQRLRNEFPDYVPTGEGAGTQ